jgi:hypothetical protein
MKFSNSLSLADREFVFEAPAPYGYLTVGFAAQVEQHADTYIPDVALRQCCLPRKATALLAGMDVSTRSWVCVIAPSLRGLGRFLFSASAKPGFHKTALVEGGFLQFSDDKECLHS